MKKLLFILLVIISAVGHSQVTPSGIFRGANNSTVFNVTIPAGNNIVDIATGRQYIVLLPLANTKTIATCATSEIRDLSYWPLKRKIYGHYIDGSANMDSMIVDTYIASAVNWNIAYTNRITSLTTTGSSGAATLSGNTLNIPQYAGSPMVYPGAGIALSTGTAWGTSIADNSANWNTAYGWGNHASAGYGLASALTTHAALSATTSTSGHLSSTDWNTFNGKQSSISVTDDVTTNASYYPLWTTGTGAIVPKISTTKLSFNPSTGILVSTNFQLSDRRFKNHIRGLDIPDFAKISKIQFCKFYLNDDPTNKNHYGVIAQDVEKILPEFVNTDEAGKKSVNYTELIVLKIAQQQEEIENLKYQIRELEKALNRVIKYEN